jgi:NADH-quinone oxidoreductase subunit C
MSQQPSEPSCSDLTSSNSPQRGNELLTLICSKLGQHITFSELSCGDAVVGLQRTGAKDFFKILKIDSDLNFDFLVDITAIDWLDSKEARFTVVYQLMSMKFGHRLRVKINVQELEPEVESLTELWHSANFHEREVWDMYGIKFSGHPDLRRVLMYDQFKGHPLRKDYPIQGKQPRVRLRAPEVENTARMMHRSNLVSITPRRSS